VVAYPVILALGRLRKEDLKFKGSLGYKIRLCLKKNLLKKCKKNLLKVVLEEWLKWQSTCLASMQPSSNPSMVKKKKKKKERQLLFVCL
jgi:hypothetical protein